MAESPTCEWMERRIAAVPDAVAATLATPVPTIDWQSPVVIAGLGSSQCAARLLAHLLNTRGGPAAVFVPMTDFFRSSHPRGGTLVVFSQGLSANSRVALARRHDYRQTVLVTSATADGLRAAGKEEAFDLLESLVADGAVIVRHPLEDEYTLLPRFIGPACALACAMAMGAVGGMPESAAMRDAFAAATADAEGVLDWAEDFVRGVEWNFTGSAAEHAGNLVAKVMECLFVRLPQPRDLMEYAHGGFQANCHRPAPQWIFCEAGEADADLLERLAPMFDDMRLIRSPLAFPYSLLYYECFLNRLLIEAVGNAGFDLIEWPGKGMDGAGYGIAAPYGPA